MILKHTVTIEQSNKRLDVILTELTPKASRNMLISWIENGNVNVNDKVILKPSLKIKENDIIETNTTSLFINEKSSILINKDAEHTNIKILFENDNLAVIDKPKNLVVHPGVGNYGNTLSDILIKKLGEDNLSSISSEEGRFGIVHRLDKDTSGLIVIAKNNFAHQHLAKQISEKTSFERKYLAVCYGVPVPSSGIINTMITKDKRKIGQMKIVDEHDNNNNAKTAITEYKVIKVLHSGAISVVECKLQTGRTHQIRAHMLHIKHPIIGDDKYYNTRYIPKIEYPKIIKNIKSQMLHAYKISFLEPTTEEKLQFYSSFNDLNNLISIFS